MASSSAVEAKNMEKISGDMAGRFKQGAERLTAIVKLMNAIDYLAEVLGIYEKLMEIQSRKLPLQTRKHGRTNAVLGFARSIGDRKVLTTLLRSTPMDRGRSIPL